MGQKLVKKKSPRDKKRYGQNKWTWGGPADPDLNPINFKKGINWKPYRKSRTFFSLNSLLSVKREQAKVDRILSSLSRVKHLSLLRSLSALLSVSNNKTNNNLKRPFISHSLTTLSWRLTLSQKSLSPSGSIKHIQNQRNPTTTLYPWFHYVQ